MKRFFVKKNNSSNLVKQGDIFYNEYIHIARKSEKILIVSRENVRNFNSNFKFKRKAVSKSYNKR